jgi:endogenous inhibitor of DNA gyrase (YacG/DUF329 family)
MIRVRCPICDRVMHGPGPAEWPQYPFCSDRCRLIDLGRWLGEDYRIATPRAEDESPAPPSDDSDIP